VIFERALAPGETPSGALDAETVLGLGIAMREIGDLDGARLRLEEALDLMRALGNSDRLYRPVCELGTVYLELGNNKLARDLLEEALSLVKQESDLQDHPEILSRLGSVLSPARRRIWLRSSLTSEGCSSR
jgi:tetratricopeptide (TPR) repeat protein